MVGSRASINPGLETVNFKALTAFPVIVEAV